MSAAKIIYTKTDEAPALATYSLLPIIEAFTQAAGVDVEIRDISLAGRIIANFPEKLSAGQRQSDALAELGKLAKTPDANIIKLPNISASIPQLTAAIDELQAKGFAIPDYPEEPKTDAEREVHERYAKVLGSAVNPVLREGNSDRRVAAAVKAFARKHPHSMGAWSPDSRTHVAHMDDGDFYGSERSAVIGKNDKLRIELETADGKTHVLRENLSVLEGEVIDAAVMSRSALTAFFAAEVAAARSEDLLLSLHVKATMMKVSDPIIFGHAVEVYYKPVFDKHAALFAELGIDADNGIGDVYAKIADLPEQQRSEIAADIDAVYVDRPPLAMVDSDKGITNLHVPSDVIIDASMPAAIRTSGKMWGPDGQAPRHQGPDSRSLLRGHLPVDDRVLQTARCVRRSDDGQRLQRRPDGAESRRVRLARQDLRDSDSGQRSCRRCVGQVLCSNTRSIPATSGGCVRPGTCPFGTGSSSPSIGPGKPGQPRSSGLTKTVRMTAS